jgi:hypothetical protein
MSRGRRSAAALTVVPQVPGNGRPRPPRGLDGLEKRIWKDVVDSLPAFWVDSAGALILRRLCAQGAVLQRREARLRELRALGLDASEEAEALAATHGAACKTAAYLLTQLRATPRSRVVSRGAGPEIESTPKLRPWEIQARG